jgi:hypothetical protein
MSFWESVKARLRAAANQDLNFEAKWIVTLSDAGMSCKRPNGEIESVTWDDLELVAIETTDEGPYLTDFFWYLIGAQGGCVVPLGATGENALIERLRALPGFDNDAVTQAAASTSNHKFICWKRNAVG